MATVVQNLPTSPSAPQPSEEVLQSCAEVAAEVLPPCPEFSVEGWSTKGVNVHSNAGGAVKIATPSAAFEYFDRRFAATLELAP